VSLELVLTETPLLGTAWWLGLTEDWCSRPPCVDLVEDVTGLRWDGCAFRYPWEDWTA
jgi:hypothetical protein